MSDFKPVIGTEKCSERLRFDSFGSGPPNTILFGTADNFFRSCSSLSDVTYLTIHTSRTWKTERQSIIHKSHVLVMISGCQYIIIGNPISTFSIICLRN